MENTVEPPRGSKCSALTGGNFGVLDWPSLMEAARTWRFACTTNCCESTEEYSAPKAPVQGVSLSLY